MKYGVKGKGKVTLTDRHFKTKGGEGSIYVKDGVVFKIYHERKKMIPLGKIEELALIKASNVIKPQDVIMDKDNHNVGFTMNLVENAEFLQRVFTTGFRDANGITNDSSIELVRNIQQGINSIHEAKCLIVDGNERNYLVDNDKFTTPYFLDVDSYKTPSYPPTAISPAIRDWQTNTLSTLTDWFSFAVIACQIFVGIHPFRGRHPDYKKTDMVARMQNSISIFNDKVTIPGATRGLECIPSNYTEWFFAMFEKGKRSIPPKDYGKMRSVVDKMKYIQGNNAFKISFVKEYDSTILYAKKYYMPIVKTKKSLHVGSTRIRVDRRTEVLFTPILMEPILVKIVNNFLVMKALNKNTIIKDIKLSCIDKMIVDNNLYVHTNDGKLVHVNLSEQQNCIVPSINSSFDLLPQSSKMFSNMLYQSALGKPFIVLPLPDKGKRGSYVVKKVNELESYGRILNAKHENGTVMLIANNGNTTDRIILQFDKTYTTYTCRIIEDITYQEINFVALDNGVVISITEDATIEVSKENMVKTINDPIIKTDMHLCKDGMNVRFFKDSKLYNLKMI